MKALHEFCVENVPWYANWHQKSHSAIHWGLFLLFATMVTNGLILMSVVESRNSSLLAAAIINLNIGSPSHGGKVFEEEQILVKFKRGISNASIVAQEKLKEKKNIPALGVKVFSISSDDTPEEVIDRLRSQGKGTVEFAELDMVYRPNMIPNDTYYSSEWHLPKVQAPEAWDMAKGAGVTIAILDSEIDATHPDLAPLLVPGTDLVANSTGAHPGCYHGTAVAGNAAAVTNNGIGIAALAPEAKLMSIVVADASTTCYTTTSTLAQGLVYAAEHGARVANVSFGPGVSNSSTFSSAAEYFSSRGGIVTVAAGNSGNAQTYPDNPYVLDVSATDQNDAVASFSTTGHNIDISAPGVGIVTTCPISFSGGYCSGTGTSSAAPIVAGTAALLFSANPSLTAAQVQNILKTTANDFGSPGWDSYYGAGRLNAFAALSRAGSPPATDSSAPTAPQGLSGSADSTTVRLSWSPSTDNVSVAGYNVMRCYDGACLNGSSSNVGVTIQCPGGSCPQAGTVSGTIYTEPWVPTYPGGQSYYVQAYDAAGNRSVPSASFIVPMLAARPSEPTPPSPPTSPAPVPAPTITSFQVKAKTGTTATIEWTTNIPTTGSVRYGTSLSRAGSTLSDTSSVTVHTVTLTGLSTNTKYYYQITAGSSSGLSATSPFSSFKTLRK